MGPAGLVPVHTQTGDIHTQNGTVHRQTGAPAIRRTAPSIPRQGRRSADSEVRRKRVARMAVELWRYARPKGRCPRWAFRLTANSAVVFESAWGCFSH